MQVLTAATLKDALISASNHLTNHQQEVNSLNIFPVPDGDTGTNMSLTCQAAAAAMANVHSDSAWEIARIASKALLRGAKGNSGVILSILWKGFAKGIEGQDTVSGAAIVDALELGVTMAYGAVMAPTEGTILTVARLAQEAGKEALAVNDGLLHVWEAICDGARAALAQTPELLHVLKRANVVDAGGMGLCLIFEGMRSVFAENTVIQPSDGTAVVVTSNHIGDDAFQKAASAYDGDTTYGYCTECIIDRNNDRSPAQLREYLTTIGDCVVVVDDEEIIKVHVHTEDPGKVLTKALEFGALVTVKVDNMQSQADALTEQSAAPAEPTEPFGFVAVAAGDGMQSLFRELGCHQVVSGGQSMNPSTEDILNAVMQTPAKVVYVLPNNKNILMAAEQAASLTEDREVVIVPTRTVPQGISALIAFSSTRTPESNRTVMIDAARHVQTGKVTYAARDSKFGTTKIKQGDLLGLIDGKLTLVEKEHDPVHTVVRLTRSMLKKDTHFITLLYGEGITEEQANTAAEKIKAKADKSVEINVIYGGQPIYYFTVSVE
ncbi:MAG: DAK2 domain-containing protein [Oscillospiraceae bacterium]|nr:DAK2 domain-containing protein [Oscillospiraceae bacterium]